MTLLSCVALLTGSLYSAILSAGSVSSVMSESFFALALEGLLFTVLIAVKYGRSGIYAFEPFTIVTLVMVLVYFVAPVFQFAAGSTSRYGVDVSKYCLAGTTLVMAGYFAFFLAYEFRLRPHPAKGKTRGVGFEPINEDDAKRLVSWAYIIWILAYALNLFYYLNRGFNIVYVVMGGLTGAEDNSLIESSLGFLAYTKFILLGAWMMIYAYGKNRLIKVALYVLMLLCMFLGGGRSTLMIALLAPVVFSFARKGKSPKFSYVVASTVGLVLLFAFMQVARTGLRNGTGIDTGGMTLGELFNPFYAEIDDFKSFYVLLGVVPEKHDFLYGSQMFFYSLVLLIPRAIWPGKPEPTVYDIIYLSFGEQAVTNGVAYPAIGEYYVEFGVVGVVVLMAIFGIVCRSLKSCYLETQGKSLAMMAYAIVYPSMLSLVIRGYFPQNFSMLLFLLAPLALFWFLLKASKRNEGALAKVEEGHAQR